MGLKPMGTDSEPKQRCGSSSRMTLWVIGHAENVRKGLRQFMEMDGWTNRQTGDGNMDGLFV